MPITRLSAELQQLSHLLEILIINETDEAQTKSLNEIHQQILSKSRLLADTHAYAQQYEAAGSCVETTNEKILAAIKDLALVPEVITALSKIAVILEKLLEDET